MFMFHCGGKPFVRAYIMWSAAHNPMKSINFQCLISYLPRGHKNVPMVGRGVKGIAMVVWFGVWYSLSIYVCQALGSSMDVCAFGSPQSLPCNGAITTHEHMIEFPI